MDLSVAKQSGNVNEPREYRKGNWTVEETMVLIEAKKMDEERRMKRLGDGGERGKPAELRWKWVEDYCWKRGCLRSQNQCNDKWDNLMRDFKKVREYEGRVAAIGGGEKSYWKIEKNERKESNLPSNMLPETYEALMEVTERKSQIRSAVVGSGGAGSSSGVLRQHSMIQQPPVIQTPTGPPPFPPQLAPTEPPTLACPQPFPVDSETSHEHSGSPAKRRKRGEREGTSGTAGGTTFEEVGSAISKSASIIAEAIQSCEEREDRRHRQMLSVHEKRLQIEESKAEINRQGINNLADAINKLANSILALAANKNQESSSK